MKVTVPPSQSRDQNPAGAPRQEKAAPSSDVASPAHSVSAVGGQQPKTLPVNWQAGVIESHLLVDDSPTAVWSFAWIYLVSAQQRLADRLQLDFKTHVVVVKSAGARSLLKAALEGELKGLAKLGTEGLPQGVEPVEAVEVLPKSLFAPADQTKEAKTHAKPNA